MIAISAIAMIGALGLIAYPTFSDWWNRMHQSYAVAGYVEQTKDMSGAERKAMLKAAHEYNERLAANGDRWHMTDAQKREYDETLDVTGTGIMGYVTIPRIKVKLPVYHGTSDGVLQIAAGHLAGTSLPVGGATTHAVAYYYETLLSQSVQDGIPFPDFSNQISSAQVGTMCPGDPLRQKKDEGIGLVTIFTRAAIQGGISFEKAYTCSDYYIQSIEAASNITEVIQLIETMYFDITNQVHEATLSAIKNPMIRECITYLDTHYREKINLEELANTLGYTKYYLSTCFKKETGVSISEYIMEKRIAYAKLMLKNPSIDMQEISDELCFANPSHFSAVFKKITGLTPTQYRNE